FFYPGVDASFVFTNAIPALKDVSFIDYGKIRGGYTKVSAINVGTTTTTFGSTTGLYINNGAYSLASTYLPGTGFPFGSQASFSANGTIVQPNLVPEATYSTEAGIELSFFKRRVAGAFTYYNQRSKGQTLNSPITQTSGYTTLTQNAGEVKNQGVEADLNITPVRLENGLTVTIGGNFNYNNNEVISLPDGTPQLALSTGGNAQLYAIPGQPYPILQGSHYQRTDDGRVKLTRTTDPSGNVYYVPLKASDNMNFGNTQPKYKYGFNAAISYKGLTLSGQGELRTSYVIYNTIGENLDFTGSGARSVTYDRQNFVFPNSAYSTDGGATYQPNTSLPTPGGSEFWASAAYN
ncbi:MAG: TonB-dependent receptor, partial [Hymenobacter sp.]